MDVSVIIGAVFFFVIGLVPLPFLVRDLRAYLRHWGQSPVHNKLIDGCGLVAMLVGLLFVFLVVIPLLVPPQQRSYYTILGIMVVEFLLDLLYVCWKALKWLWRGIGPSMERLSDRLPDPKLPPGYLEAEHFRKEFDRQMKPRIEKINKRFRS